MTKKYFFLFFLFVFQLLANYILGQIDYRAKSKHSILAGINSDGFLGIECGYNYKSNFTINKNNLCLGSKLAFPVLINIKENSFRNWEAGFSVQSNILHPSKYNINVELSLYSVRHTQILGNFFTLGNQVKITPLYMFKSKAYLGLQFELRNSLTTHITPSGYVESTYQEIYDKNNFLIYNSPKSAWYKSTGTSIKTGFESFTPICEKTGFYFDLGLQYFNSKYFSYFDNMAAGLVPFYLSISITQFL